MNGQGSRLGIPLITCQVQNDNELIRNLCLSQVHKLRCIFKTLEMHEGANNKFNDWRILSYLPTYCKQMQVTIAESRGCIFCISLIFI